MSKHFYTLGIKITLTSNQVKPADKFWASPWKNLFFISINNNRLPNIMRSDNLEPFRYLLQTSQCSAAFCKFTFILICMFWKAVMLSMILCWHRQLIWGSSFQKNPMIEKIRQSGDVPWLWIALYCSIISSTQGGLCFLKGIEPPPSAWLASRWSFHISYWADWLKGKQCCPTRPNTTSVKKKIRSNLVPFMCLRC